MRKTLSFIFLFIALITQATTVTVSSVYTEQMSNPLGLDTTTPRFSLQMQSDGQGVMQTAYRILVASSVEMLTENKADLWDSGRGKHHFFNDWCPSIGKAFPAHAF